MKFARHLAAVLLTVAIIVALGMTWAHASQAGLPGGPHRGPGVVAILHPGHAVKINGKLRVIRLAAGGGPSPSQLGDLIRTIVIEAAIAVVVVAINVGWRRRRAVKRPAAKPEPAAG